MLGKHPFHPKDGSCRCATARTAASPRVVRTQVMAAPCLHLLTNLHAGHKGHRAATQMLTMAFPSPHVPLRHGFQQIQGPGPRSCASTGQRGGTQTLRASPN